MSRGRSANGRSSIYRDARGTWHGYVSMGRTIDGESVRRHVRGRTRSEVTRKVEVLEAERDRSAARPAATPRLTVGAWLDEWLTIIQRTRKPKTHDSYVSITRTHCGPIRGVGLTKLTVRDIDNLLHAVAQTSPQSAASLHRILRSSFNTAIKRGLMVANPCQHAVVPRVREIELEPYTLEECQRILEAAAHHPNTARWSVALALGLRQGEALGLQWKDIDFEAGELRIRRQLQRLSWHHGCGEESPGHNPSHCPQRSGGGWAFEDVKTKAGRRAIALPAPLIDQLRRHRQQQAQAKLAAGPAWHDHELVFPRPDGNPQHPSVDATAWHRLTVDAQVPQLRLHYARHTTATMLLVQGIDGRVVMGLLGWSQSSLLGRYQHVIDPLRREAAARMQDALWPPDRVRGG